MFSCLRVPHLPVNKHQHNQAWNKSPNSQMKERRRICIHHPHRHIIMEFDPYLWEAAAYEQRLLQTVVLLISAQTFKGSFDVCPRRRAQGLRSALCSTGIGGWRGLVNFAVFKRQGCCGIRFRSESIIFCQRLCVSYRKTSVHDSVT